MRYSRDVSLKPCRHVIRMLHTIVIPKTRLAPFRPLPRQIYVSSRSGHRYPQGCAPFVGRLASATFWGLSLSLSLRFGPIEVRSGPRLDSERLEHLNLVRKADDICAIERGKLRGMQRLWRSTSQHG